MQSPESIRATSLTPKVHLGLLLGLLAVAVVFSYSDRLVLNLLIDPIRRDLHLTDTQFSVLQGASFGLVFAAANPVVAWLRIAPRGA